MSHNAQIDESPSVIGSQSSHQIAQQTSEQQNTYEPNFECKSLVEPEKPHFENSRPVMSVYNLHPGAEVSHNEKQEVAI
jgi:hypothetical protein